MAERNRPANMPVDFAPDDPRRAHEVREATENRDWPGYDEAARSGPPLGEDVSAGDYHPTRYWLAGAGVRGYGEDAGARWPTRGYGEAGEHFGPESRGEPDRHMENAARAPGPHMGTDRAPPDYGTPTAWGRIGGWHRGDTGALRRSAPKGYKRSDDRIREDICEHLMDIRDIDVSDVEVRVQDSRVVLEGTVPERSMKYEIEDIAAGTLGVTDVENNIRVPRRSQE